MKKNTFSDLLAHSKDVLYLQLGCPFFVERMNIFILRMSFFVDGMYFARSGDVNTYRWILVHQLFLYYILTTSKLHPNYKNVHPNYEKGHPISEKLHPILRANYISTTRKEVKFFLKC